MKAQKMIAARARKYLKPAAFAAVPGSFVLATAANAADWSSMTTGLSFAGEETAIIAIVGVLFGFYVVRKGATLLLSMIR